MIPNKSTLSKLKAEIYINAVRLFIDACTLYKNRSYASAFALAILSFEEIGKLEMVDHICDDISINPDSNPQDFLNHLFSRPMFFNHKNKQVWAADPIFNFKKKRFKDIAGGVLEQAKQAALYVGYFNRRIRSPRTITRIKVFNEISTVFKKFTDVEDLGFNGFDCWSDAQSRAKTKRWFVKIEKAYANLNKPKQKP
jgi:AbiV family abortive infection protein